MFGSLFTNLRANNNNEPQHTKRRYSRRYCDKCVAVIDGSTYPVENWSMGGLMVLGDPRPFGVDNNVDINIKFKTSNDVISVVHRGRVVRKTNEKIALEFSPINRKIKSSLQSVINDFVSARVANPKMA